MSGQACVRLRVPRAAFWSPLMDTEKADALADELETRIAGCGDRWDFVRTDGYDGREIRVRGRDVFAIEVIPEGSMPEPRRLPSTGVGAVAGVVVNGGGLLGGGAIHAGSMFQQPSGISHQGEGGEAPGTAFLRNAAARRQQSVGGPR